MKRNDIYCLSCHSSLVYREKRGNSNIFQCQGCKMKISIFNDFFVRQRGKGAHRKKEIEVCTDCKQPSILYAKKRCLKCYKRSRQHIVESENQQLKNKIKELEDKLFSLQQENYLLNNPLMRSPVDHGLDCICTECSTAFFKRK
jgi:hypothetical protein